MCYTCVIINTKQVGKEGLTFVLNTFNFINFNPDGYAIRFDNNVLRTLNKKEFINFVLRNREKIMNSKIVHIHYRNATSGTVNLNNVHLWKFKNYYCSQFGTSDGGNEEKSDSLQLFENLQNLEINLKNVKKLVEEKGKYGVYFLTGNDKIYAAAQNKKIFIYLVKNTLILSSHQIKLKRNVFVEISKKKFFGIEFPIFQKISIPPLSEKTLKAEKENVIIEINLNNKKSRIEELEISKLRYWYWTYKKI